MFDHTKEDASEFATPTSCASSAVRFRRILGKRYPAVIRDCTTSRGCVAIVASVMLPRNFARMPY